MENKKDIREKRVKPAPYIADNSLEPVSKEEIEKRKRVIQRAERIGLSFTRLDTEGEYENPYKLEALKYINEDKEVPVELERKILEFEEEHRLKGSSKN